jgi:beta-glucosidase
MSPTPRGSKRFPIFFVAFLAACQGLAQEAPPGLGAGTLKSPDVPVEQRVADLMQRMTVEEKIELLSGGTGMGTRAIPRLGIPQFKMSDGPMGARCYGPSTAYPNGVTLAASWDVDQARRAGVAIGRDCRSRGVHILLAPGMNLYRAPMCGRNFEYLGEDPVVAGSLASAFITGVQSQGVAATAKHFAGNEQEYSRHTLDTVVAERTLRELYLKPFQICVKNGVRCVMDSYNPLNGIHSTENDWLNNTILKGEFGFQGVLMSDWDSCYNTAGMANGGLDLEMPRGRFFNQKMLLPLLADGTVKQAVIDDKIRRILRLGFSMGWFDRPQEDASIPKDDPQNAAVALEGAREGIALLKNEGNLLPLDPAKLKSIAVLGRHADPAVVGGVGSAFTVPFHSVSTLKGIGQLAGAGVNVVHVPWTNGQAAVPPEFAQQVKDAGVAIVCVGYNDQGDPNANATMPGAEGEGVDRSYALPLEQAALIQSVAALNPRTIVILNAGGSVETAGWIGKVPVLVDAFYPGQEGGTAVAEVLFGKTNPSGKLPFSWERTWEDSAAYGNYPTAANPKVNDYKEGIFTGYRWFDSKGTEPLFPFGFGESYTTFAVTDAKVSKKSDDTYEVAATIQNTGNRPGADVMQAYIEPPQSDAPRPVRELKAFARVSLNPGESKTVTMPIARADLAYWDPSSKSWVVTPGGYTARVGDSSRNLPAAAGFRIDE